MEIKLSDSDLDKLAEAIIKRMGDRVKTASGGTYDTVLNSIRPYVAQLTSRPTTMKLILAVLKELESKGGKFDVTSIAAKAAIDALVSVVSKAINSRGRKDDT